MKFDKIAIFCTIKVQKKVIRILDNNVYTVKQIADILQISPKTMYQIVKDGAIDILWVRGQIRSTSAALRRYLEGECNEGKGSQR